jgi:hypothetical protein
MAAPFVPKPPRGRIPVSDEDRAAGRSRMDGEKTKQASEAAAVPNQPVALVSTEPAAPVAAELVAPVVETAPDVATTPAAEAAPEPAPVATAPAPTKPAPQPTATPGRRGRKPTVATEQGAEPPAVRSVKIRESVWGDIKLLLALLPKEENTPRNIQAYVEAAHQHYEAHLRKQGKLPSK